MSTQWNTVLDTVREAVGTGRIGTPVALRLIVQADTGTTGLESLSRWAADAAATLLGEEAIRTSIEPAGSGRHETRLNSYVTGKTALLTASHTSSTVPTLQLVLFGNRGILSWESPDCRFGNLPPGAEPSPPIATRRAVQEPPFGVLLVAGDHTHQPMYVEAFQADSRCELIGLADSDDITSQRRELNKQLADRLRIPLLSDLGQALDRRDVHIASICAEPFRRGPLIVQAARAGKHLYLDKPLAGSLSDADSIVTVVRETGVVAQMFSFVHTGHVTRIRQLLQSGQLGRLQAIHCDHCFAKGHAGSATLGRPRDEHASPERYELPDAKRELTNVGVYPLVLLLTLLQRRVCCVSATTGNYFFSEHQTRDMEDFGQILLQLDDGVVASCTTGRTGWRSHPGSGLNRVTLIGTEASVVVDADQPRLEVWADADPWRSPPRNPEDPMGMWVLPPSGPYRFRPKQDWISPSSISCLADVERFLDCVQYHEQCDIDVQVAAQATEILLAAYRSAAEHRPVPLPLPRDESAA